MSNDRFYLIIVNNDLLIIPVLINNDSTTDIFYNVIYVMDII